ncbi:hypothetical protein K6959_09270 [Bacillus aquiflavi]|uniref:HAD family hydrolase n=1 Tax=Bacillus aquiflavi TaxID=2672567 RepID=UPI001CA881AD|nr:HAD family hydrolase [Bacillus aquiflavi]UAC46966.1 hypothetical protein K6959_09270 [Bacillus aquiflavi]
MSTHNHHKEAWKSRKIMFASDLDRTIIYSTRALKQYPLLHEKRLISVEKKAGEDTAFMTKKTLNLLLDICNDVLFVPVTTRSIQQFIRLLLFEHGILLPYAITSNGGTVLVEGKLDKQWQDMMTNLLKNTSSPRQEILSLLQKHSLNIEQKIKVVDDLFFYCRIDSPLHIQVHTLNEIVNPYGWNVWLHGKKLYFIPKVVSKGRAVNYIKEKEGITTVLGAGDSLLDEEFLIHCTKGFIPKHGELSKKNTQSLKDYYISETEGIAAGEEIESQILRFISNGNL